MVISCQVNPLLLSQVLCRSGIIHEEGIVILKGQGSLQDKLLTTHMACLLVWQFHDGKPFDTMLVLKVTGVAQVGHD